MGEKTSKQYLSIPNGREKKNILLCTKFEFFYGVRQFLMGSCKEDTDVILLLGECEVEIKATG